MSSSGLPYSPLETDDGTFSPPSPRRGGVRLLWKVTLFLSLVLLLVGVQLREELSPYIPRRSIRRRIGGRHALELPPHLYWGDTPRSPPRVWGQHLSSARQNVPSAIYIDFDDTPSSPLAPEEAIVVTLEGPSRFAATVDYAGRGRFVATYTPLDAGEYTLRADIYRRDNVSLPYLYWQPLHLGNLTVSRQDGTFVHGDGRLELGESLPRLECTGDESNTDGRWVRCEDTEQACTRYGWIWVPRTCQYHIYTSTELAQQDLWLAIVGTSVFRGIFFSGLDHLLGDRAANLTAPDSGFWKCWGRLSVATQRLRLSYLDFREQCIRTVDANLCVGPYARNTEEMLGLMGREREGRGPDLVLWEVNPNSGTNFTTLPMYKRWLGEGWEGSLVAMHRTISPEVVWEEGGGAKGLAAEYRKNPESGVEVMDVSTVGCTMFETMEYGLEKSSFHWHTRCDLEGMHSCSPVDDMLFQMILNRAVQTQRQRQRSLSPSPSSPPAPSPTAHTPSLGSAMQFCLQCPAHLDFSIRPEIEPRCFDTLPGIIV